MLRGGEHHRHLLPPIEPWLKNNPMIKTGIPPLYRQRLSTNCGHAYYLMHVLHTFKFDSTF